MTVTTPSQPTSAFYQLDVRDGDIYVLKPLDQIITVWLPEQMTMVTDEPKFSLTILLWLVFSSSMENLAQPTSVDSNDATGVAAVAAGNANDQTLNSRLFFIDAETLEIVNFIVAGSLPDHISFGTGGTCAYSANEGEPAGTNPFGGVTQVCADDWKEPSSYSSKTVSLVAMPNPPDLSDYFGAHNANGNISDFNVNLEPECISYGLLRAARFLWRI